MFPRTKGKRSSCKRCETRAMTRIQPGSAKVRWTYQTLLIPMILMASLACVPSVKTGTGDVVTLCRITVPRNLQDATFTLTYKFETAAHGKLINVTRVKNDFLPDQPFSSCMAHWRLPSISGQGVAEFSRTPTEGWTEIHVSGKGFDQSFYYH